MSSKVETVKAYIWAEGAKDNAHLLSDDFQNIDSEGNVVAGKQGYLAMQGAIQQSLPDIQYVLSDIYEDGDGVVIDGHFEGTFINDLDMSAAGMGVIPAHGRKIVWPDSSAKWMVEGGQIVSVMPHGENGGMQAFFAPLMA